MPLTYHPSRLCRFDRYRHPPPLSGRRHAPFCAWLTAPSCAQVPKKVRETALIIAFFSKGYFQSHGCLRELRTAMDARVPVQVVHAAENADQNQKTHDISEYLDECSEAVRAGLLPRGTADSVFSDRPAEPLRWLR
jgi:hypothetical protein